MGNLRVIQRKWKKFPDTAPKDREILVFGRWKPYDILPGGNPCFVIAQWSTLMSNGTGHDWYTGLCKLGDYNVNFTYWRDLPEGPDETT